MVGQAYTHWNLALFVLWASGKHLGGHWSRPIGSILWCNSWAVVASYESVRILNGNAYAGFLKSVSPWREDVIAHWLPIVVLWIEGQARRNVNSKHVCAAIALEFLWACTIAFDLAYAYPDIQPPLTAPETACVWVCGLLGHIAPLQPRLPWWVPYIAWAGLVLRQAALDGY